ncbi:MAG: tetratricopeptide repeat protein, partial [Planctomycetes bacterium]|nr:tetratricopeptide repeat protein [Planctomycetota bacterium]
RYRVLGRIGEGGMGEVFEVEDTVKERVVALKLLKDPRAAGALEEEFETLRRVGSHPAIAQVHEFGIAEDRRSYFTMERIHGQDLAAWTSARPDPAGTARLFARVAAALEFLHDRGVLHGDLKPGNILVAGAPGGDPAVKILDFGLARAARPQGDGGDSSAGTVFYMAPEVLRGEPYLAASDLYALGILIYQALAGHVPFDSPSLSTLVRAHMEIPPPPLPPGVPAPLAALARELLAKDPARRPAGAHAVRARLAEFLEEDPVPPAERPDNVRHYLESARLVGRDRELSLLVSLGRRLQETRRYQRERGEPLRFVLVSGETGRGKSRLLAEYEYRLQKSGVLCFLSRFQEADVLARDHLRRVLAQMVHFLEERSPRTLRDHAAALLAVLPELASRESMRGAVPPAPLQPREERARFFHDLLAFLKDFLVAGRELEPPVRSIALLFDDLGLAPASVFDLLHFLLENVEDARIQVIATFRTDRGGEPCFGPARERVSALARAVERDERSALLPLAPLSAREIGSLVATSLGEGPDLERLAESLAEHGHDLLVFQETLSGLAADGLLAREEGHWRWRGKGKRLPVPEGLAAAVDAHLAALDPEVRSVLEAASVFGREFEVELLAEALGTPDVSRPRATVHGLAGARRFLARTESRPRERFGFASPSVRERVYSGIPPERARELHARIARAISRASDEGPTSRRGELAYHISRTLPSDALKNPESLALLLEEAAARESRFQYAEAADLLGSAVLMARALGDAGRTVECHRRLGHVLGLAGRIKEGLSELARAKELLEAGPERAAVLREIGSLALKTGDHRGALAAFQDSLAELGPDPEPLLAAAICRETAQTLSFREEWDEATRLAARALDLARTAPESTRRERELGDIHNICGTILYCQGELDRADVCFAESLAHRERAGDRLGVTHALHNRGLIRWAKGDVEGAMELLKESLERGRELVDVHGMANTYNTLGILHHDRGELAEAERYFARSVDLFREAQNVSGLAKAMNNLGNVRLKQGRTQEAQELYEKAYRTLQRIRETWLTPASLKNFARVALYRGEFARAERLYLRTLRRARSGEDLAGHASARLGLALVDLARGEIPAALRHLLKSRRSLARAQSRTDLGPVLATLARVHLLAAESGRSRSLARAERAAREAIEAAGEVSHMEPAAEAHGAMALVLAGRGEGESAVREAEQALELHTRSASAILVARARRDLAVASAARGPDWDDRTEEEFRGAIEAFRKIEAPAEIAWTQVAYARFLADAGSRAEAASLARKAAKTFDSIAAPRAAERAREILAEVEGTP